MTRIPSHTVDDAPEASRALLQEMTQFSPTGRPLNMHAQMAHSPAVLEAFTVNHRCPTQRGAILQKVTASAPGKPAFRKAGRAAGLIHLSSNRWWP